MIRSRPDPHHHQPHYSLSRHDKIEILEELLQEMLPPTPLKVNQTVCGIPEDNASSSHIYEILGNFQRRKTQNTNLQYKLKDVQDIILPINEGQKPPQEQPTQNRYFKPNIRCFRCKQFGHYSSHCPDESIFCLHCLAQSHSAENCPQKTVCFRCYDFGHIANSCRAPEGIFCRQCSRKHREQCGFLARGYDNSKTLIVRDTDEMSEVVCLYCHQKGHINCHFQYQH